MRGRTLRVDLYDLTLSLAGTLLQECNGGGRCKSSMTPSETSVVEMEMEGGSWWFLSP